MEKLNQNIIALLTNLNGMQYNQQKPQGYYQVLSNKDYRKILTDNKLPDFVINYSDQHPIWLRCCTGSYGFNSQEELESFLDNTKQHESINHKEK